MPALLGPDKLGSRETQKSDRLSPVSSSLGMSDTQAHHGVNGLSCRASGRQGGAEGDVVGDGG